MPRLLVPAPLRGSPIELLRARDLPDRELRARAARDVRVRPGVYADGGAWRQLPPWERYLARVHAWAAVQPEAVFSHESAAALWGLPIFGEPRDIHVFDAGRPRSRRFGDVLVHTSENPPLVHSVSGIRLVDPAHTAVELMRLLPPAFALAVGDAVIAPKGGFGVPSTVLAELASASTNRRGIRQLDWLWPRLDGRAESPGESVSRAVIQWCGFAEPDLQREFRFEGSTDRTDFFWDRVRAAGESDGYGKYAGAEAARVIAEKRREDRLRRNLDGFARWDWADTMRVAPLRHALISAGVPIVRPPASALLQTLRAHPRSR